MCSVVSRNVIFGPAIVFLLLVLVPDYFSFIDHFLLSLVCVVDSEQAYF